MQPTLLILPVLVPVAFWAGYHYHKDRHLPEPVPNLLIAFALGLIAMLISKSLYLGLELFDLRYDAVELASNDRLGLLLYAVFAIGPIEEFAKMLPFLVIILRMKAFDEPLDGIIYASFIGLGYAAAENFLYLDYLTPLHAAARGFASPVVHILFASIWGHWIADAWLSKRPIAGAVVAGFTIAAILHGAYDFLVLQSPVSALPIAAGLILMLWVWRLMLMRRLHRAAKKFSKGQPRS